MLGPAILARSLTTASIPDEYGNRWQYHSRSDRHSKVACWAVLFDLLQQCRLLAAHADAGKIGFGINHLMVDFRNNRRKKLDLVLCTPAREDSARRLRSFRELAGPEAYTINLTSAEREILARLPNLQETRVGSVLVAIEAKACMTAHQKALPRLYDELNSSHLTIHGAADQAIAAGFVMINAAEEFISPDRNRHPLATMEPRWNRHTQPRAASLVVGKVEQIPRRSGTGEAGFDAMAITVIDCRNDGSPVRLLSQAPSPDADDIFRYERFVDRLSQLYASRFSTL